MTGYNTIFGGSAVYPSNQTYTAITLSATTNLSWPIESVSSNTIVADLMDVTPTVPGAWNLVLPDATGGSTGITMIINNLSNTYSFNVVTNAALTLVVAVPPGTVWLIYLTDNSTTDGVWATFQYGAQAGSVNVAAIAGAGLLAIGSSLNQSMPVTAKATNYSLASTDRATVILWQGAGGTLTLPTPASVGSNWFVNIVNQGTGDVAVTPAAGLIDGAASKNFTFGTGSAIVFTDGTNFYTLGYSANAGASSFNYTTINAAGSDGVNGVITLSGGQLNKVSYKVFGALTGTRTIIVPANVQQYWINNATTSTGGPWTLSVKTAAQPLQPPVTVSQPGQAIMYCDGSDVVPAISGITLPLAIGSGGTGATSAPVALTNLGGTAVGTALFQAVNAQAARNTLGSTTATIGDLLFTDSVVNTALTRFAGGTLTGALTISGLLTAGQVAVTSGSAPVNGMYLQSANSVGFTTNSILAGRFDNTQNLVLTHALPIASGGTSGTTVLAAANALGDQASSANSLAQRNGSADLFTRTFNMSLAADNFAISHVMYQQASDGYLRRMTLANFITGIGFDKTTATNGSITLPNGMILLWGATADIGSAGGVGNVSVNFHTAFPTANYFVTIIENNTYAAGSAQAASRAILSSRTAFLIQNNSNGTQRFNYFAIGI